ncbi:MAG: GlcG/HbpS family heme-binding protein [Xanthobacteraceae bacterium]
MSLASCRLAGLGLACILAAPANAELLTHKDLSAEIAVTMAQTAMATCTTNGYRVSATVLGRNGEVLVQIRGDGTGPHTMENSFKKAFTARTFRIPSGEMEARLKQNPQMGAQYLTGFTTARGALPITVNDDVIGALGVSGAPGGEKDEACVKSGIDKVAGQLR